VLNNGLTLINAIDMNRAKRRIRINVKCSSSTSASSNDNNDSKSCGNTERGAIFTDGSRYNMIARSVSSTDLNQPWDEVCAILLFHDKHHNNINHRPSR
jgi:hypothetical protein